jgi:hypothetical protein
VTQPELEKTAAGSKENMRKEKADVWVTQRTWGKRGTRILWPWAHVFPTNSILKGQENANKSQWSSQEKPDPSRGKRNVHNSIPQVHTQVRIT